ncbi:extracellular solute-binding protein [Botrimarina hoheduenensis]|uniref:Putative binding protein component of ABC iron transporter n=1 Tax=Botrimarina hoheduenensis TaxID=2528000 RepID=A0A5C5W8B6_9BACT|nr:extracellular solute-binding protein [Botrimarina hoheduenensis]TWT46425.1 putative binding protein component of ABC iron transporter precursor [Botrimarina hoheduenensis]
MKHLTSARRIARWFVQASLALSVLLALGCGAPEVPKEVVVYTSLDEEFSKPIFAAYERNTGIKVVAVYDTESTKTLGLVNRLIAEKDAPQCDLYWNNEMLHTLRLKRLGLLRKQPLEYAQDYPREYRSKDNDWYGFAARARVLLVNTDQLKRARWPDSIEDLTDPQWADRCGIAKPLFGTTATHAACLHHTWGAERFEKFFKRVKSNCRILSGNRRVAKDVAEGKLLFGLTDTDDAMLEKESGAPVEIIYPDQLGTDGAEALGVLFIPNSLGLIAGSPQPEAGHAMAEFLLTPMVECRLVDGPSAQIPLNKNSNSKARVKTPSEVTPMKVDWEAAAEGWDSAAKFLAEEFSIAL